MKYNLEFSRQHAVRHVNQTAILTIQWLGFHQKMHDEYLCAFERASKAQ